MLCYMLLLYPLNSDNLLLHYCVHKPLLMLKIYDLTPHPLLWPLCTRVTVTVTSDRPRMSRRGDASQTSACLSTAMSVLLSSVDWSKTSLLVSLAAIAFNPTAWNIVARNGECNVTFKPTCLTRQCCTTEYRNKTITKLFGGNARYGCYFLTVMIFSFGIIRDTL